MQGWDLHSCFSSSVFAGGAQRPEAQQHPLRGRERERRVHQDLRLWFRQTAEGGERPAHDAVLHRQLRRAGGESGYRHQVLSAKVGV